MTGPHRRSERIPDPDGPLHPILSYAYDQHGYDEMSLEEGLELSRRQGELLESTGEVSGTDKELRFVSSSRHVVGGGWGAERRTRGEPDARDRKGASSAGRGTSRGQVGAALHPVFRDRYRNL